MFIGRATLQRLTQLERAGDSLSRFRLAWKWKKSPPKTSFIASITELEKSIGAFDVLCFLALFVPVSLDPVSAKLRLNLCFKTSAQEEISKESPADFLVIGISLWMQSQPCQAWIWSKACNAEICCVRNRCLTSERVNELSPNIDRSTRKEINMNFENL